MVEIVLRGPGKNALGSALMQQLHDRFDEAGSRPVLLVGDGDAFSAGLDLREVASLDVTGMDRFLRLLDRLLVRIWTHPAPVVAVVNGHAIAGGCLVAMACDHRVAARGSSAKIGLNEVALGLRFPPRALEIARRRSDPRHLEAVVLGAELHGVDDAYRLGLLDAIADDARAAGEQRLAKLAAHPAEAYAAAKRAIRGELRVSEEDDRRFLEEVLPTWASAELKAKLAKILAR